MSHFQGQRFELNADDIDAEVTRTSSSAIIGEIKERTGGTSVHTPPVKSATDGFPKVRRRSQAEKSTAPRVSRFKAALEQQKNANVIEPGSTRLAPDADISAENDKILSGMSEDDILRDREQIMSMLGEDTINFLKNRHRNDDGAAVPRKRSVRFNEDVQYSNPPSRSPSPPPVRKAIPMPAPEGQPTVGDWLQSTIEKATPTSDVEEGSSEDIRRRFFPQEPLKASMDWMSDSPVASTSRTEAAVRFDLHGKIVALPPAAAPSSDADRHAASTESFALADLIQLGRSTVSAQRMIALQVLLRIVTGHVQPGDASEASKELRKAETVNSVIAVCAVNLLDKQVGAVSLAIGIIHAYTLPSDLLPNVAVGILTATPSPLQTFSRLLSTSPPVQLPKEASEALLEALHRLVTMREDFIAQEVVDASRLLENITDTYLVKSWPPNGTDDLPQAQAAAILVSVAQRSRASAEQVVYRKLEQPLMRFLAVSPWSIAQSGTRVLAIQLATHTLSVLSSLAEYGFGCANLGNYDDIFNSLQSSMSEHLYESEGLSLAWFSLLRNWATCALDPHSTTPEHDILWSQVQDWADHFCDCLFIESDADVSISLQAAIVSALSVWTTGAKKHNKAAMSEMEARLAESSERLSRSINAASVEPITTEKANLLLAMKRFITQLDSSEALQGVVEMLDRVQVEDSGPLTGLSDHINDDEGWI